MKKKFLTMALGMMAFSFSSFATVMTITIHGFQGPRDNGTPTTSPAPGGTTYSINCYPSSGTCTTFTVIIPDKETNAYVGSYGELSVYNNDGSVSSVSGYCKDVSFDENNLVITLSAAE